MLKELKVEQFVIIDKLDLDFKPGLTIFTGETGAGKSIILGAMALILGDPSTPDSIRQGAKESVFEALFAPPAEHPVWKYLIDKGLATSSDTEFKVHRIMGHADKTQDKDKDQATDSDKNTDQDKDKDKGKGKKDKVLPNPNDKIRLNDKEIELEVLNKVGTFLVEIHGQFANQSLLGPENQLGLLDLSGGFPPEILKNVADALDDVHRYERELEEEETFLARHRGLVLKKMEGVAKKFSSVGMGKGFIEEIKAEYETLRTAKETMEAFQSILGRLIAGNGVVVSLSSANNTLDSQKNLEAEKMKDLSRYLNDALANSRDAVEEMGRLLPEYEIDIDPLNKCKNILGVLKSISQEAKIKFNTLEDYYLDLTAKLDRVYNGREQLEKIKNALIKSKNSYKEHAHILTEKRIIAAKELSQSITAELAPLKLNKAEFEVVVEEKPEMTWTRLGFNVVTFTARMNPGSPFSPISETASGGELARMILALKVVLQRVQTTLTLVFDEVDTGIGGAAAAAVGDRIGHLSASTQVLVITHSPQVASRGEQHLHISKKTDGVTTTSAVNELTMEERINEISRMLAGEGVTEESQAAAKSLIDEAQKVAVQRRQSA